MGRETFTHARPDFDRNTQVVLGSPVLITRVNFEFLDPGQFGFPEEGIRTFFCPRDGSGVFGKDFLRKVESWGCCILYGVEG